MMCVFFATMLPMNSLMLTKSCQGLEDPSGPLVTSPELLKLHLSCWFLVLPHGCKFLWEYFVLLKFSCD